MGGRWEGGEGGPSLESERQGSVRGGEGERCGVGWGGMGGQIWGGMWGGWGGTLMTLTL